MKFELKEEHKVEDLKDTFDQTKKKQLQRQCFNFLSRKE